MDGDGFSLSEARVAIIGLGLMGGSLAMDLRGHCRQIAGTSRSPQTEKYALDHEIVDEIVRFDERLECDLLIMAAPVRTIIEQIHQMSEFGNDRNRKKRTVVLDLGSTKAGIVNAMKGLPDQFDPIGGHPMWGKEGAGIQNAGPGLYQEKVFVLSPLERTSSEAIALIHEVVDVLGSQPVFLEAERQDALVARTSHLPYLAAAALVAAAASYPDERLWELAASGFRDTSRLAASDVTMMLDILMTNRPAVLQAVREFQTKLDDLTELLISGKEPELRKYLADIQQRRATIFSQGK